MTVALWDVAQVTAVADAIRAKTGKSATMTVAEMPAEIASIPSGGTEVWKECWLEKPKSSPTVFLDTGIRATFNDELEVTCRCSIGSMSACFNACGSSGTRNGMNFLPNSNRAQVFWGGYANTNITIDRVNLDVTNDMVITQNSSGVSIAGFNSNGAAVTWDNPYTATGTSAPAQPYRLFIYDRNVDIKYGLFRKAVIVQDGGYQTFTIVPEVSNNFTARLKITNHVLDEGSEDIITYVPVPAGFVCHVDNVASA